MKPVLITKSSRKVDDYGSALVKEYLIDKGGSFSLAQVDYNGRFPEKGWIKNRKCNETYYIISGRFTIGTSEEEKYELKSGDLLVMPKGIKYYVEGKGKLISINDPPFDINQLEEIK